MSVVSLDQVKQHLRVIHTADDELLELLIAGAEDELKQYLDRDELPRKDDPCACECESDSSLDPASDSDDLAPTVRVAIFFLVQAAYDGTSADEVVKLRAAAFSMAALYRCRLGA